MSDLIRTAGQNAWLWRTIMFKGFNGWFITVAGAVMAAHLLTPYQESVLGCIVAGNKFLEGFINQDVGSLKSQILQADGLSKIQLDPPPTPQPISTEPPKP